MKLRMILRTSVIVCARRRSTIGFGRAYDRRGEVMDRQNGGFHTCPVGRPAEAQARGLADATAPRARRPHRASGVGGVLRRLRAHAPRWLLARRVRRLRPVLPRSRRILLLLHELGHVHIATAGRWRRPVPVRVGHVFVWRRRRPVP